MKDEFMKVTLDDGSVAEFSVSKAEPNPYFDKLTTQVKINETQLRECEQIAKNRHRPLQVIFDSVMANGLKVISEMPTV
jgi:hypothetical protein